MAAFFTQERFPDIPDDRSQRLVNLWLLAGCILIYLMVLTGGITRLTNSGLSMVNWNFVLGSLPPLSDADWQIPFERYKLSPQYLLINHDFGLEEFKHIYWWEYWHRFIGRFIGFFFLVPYVWFIRRKAFSARRFRQASFLLLLGVLQGLLGWFMVKSGLNKAPHVSHYRLAMHLGNAFLLYFFTFSFFLESFSGNKAGRSKPLLTIFTAIVFLQIILGAFVSGLKAGLIYNTYPLMGGHFLPPELPSLLIDPATAFSSGVAVQFLHRSMALLVVLFAIKVLYDTRKIVSLKRERLFLAGAVIVQFSLGVIALLTHVPVLAGVLHQAGAFILFSAVILFRKNYR